MPEERNDARQLSPVLENYLEIIFHQEIREGAARASSIAEAAGVSRSTVTSTLKALKSMGYVDYEPYSLVHLTEAGMHIGRDIAHRHIVIQAVSYTHLTPSMPPTASSLSARTCALRRLKPYRARRRTRPGTSWTIKNSMGVPFWRKGGKDRPPSGSGTRPSRRRKKGERSGFRRGFSLFRGKTKAYRKHRLNARGEHRRTRPLPSLPGAVPPRGGLRPPCRPCFPSRFPLWRAQHP